MNVGGFLLILMAQRREIGSVDMSWGFHRLAAIYSNHFHTALPVFFLSYIVSDVTPSERENVRRRDRAMPFPKTNTMRHEFPYSCFLIGK